MLSKYFFALVLTIQLPVAEASAQEKLHCSVVAVPDWYDLVINKGTALEGPLHSMISKIFAPTYHTWGMADPMPWRRSMQQLENGQHDAAVPVLMTESRRDQYEFVGPVGQFWTRYIENTQAPKNGVLVTSVALKVVDGYESEIAEYSEIIWADTNERAWRIFEMGRAQFALLPSRETNMMNFAIVTEHFEFDPKLPIAQPLYMMIRKDSHCMQDIPAITTAKAAGRLTLW